MTRAVFPLPLWVSAGPREPVGRDLCMGLSGESGHGAALPSCHEWSPATWSHAAPGERTGWAPAGGRARAPHQLSSGLRPSAAGRWGEVRPGCPGSQVGPFHHAPSLPRPPVRRGAARSEAGWGPGLCWLSPVSRLHAPGRGRGAELAPGCPSESGLLRRGAGRQRARAPGPSSSGSSCCPVHTTQLSMQPCLTKGFCQLLEPSPPCCTYLHPLICTGLYF